MLFRGSSNASLQAAPIPRGPDLTPCGRDLSSNGVTARHAERRRPPDAESYFVWRGALAFVSDRRYADMSASSWPLSVGSLRPCFAA